MNVELYDQIVHFIDEFQGTDRECILELSKIHPTIEKTTLGSIHTLIEQRKTTKNVHKVKNNVLEIYESTVKRLSQDDNDAFRFGIIRKMAKENGIQPGAMARVLLEHYLSITESSEEESEDEEEEDNNTLYEVLQDTTLINDKRLSWEIFMCNVVDCVYGPLTDLIKNCIGMESELALEKVLLDAGVSFKSEHDLRDTGYDKTPDILLEIPVAVDGEVIYWIESKALFADVKNHTQYANDQYLSYFNSFASSPAEMKSRTRLSSSAVGALLVEHQFEHTSSAQAAQDDEQSKRIWHTIPAGYGPGLVIYWCGYLESILFIKEFKNKFIVNDRLPDFTFYNPDDIEIDCETKNDLSVQ